MSLLSVIQGAAVRCGVTQPAAALSSVDPIIQQMVAFAQDSALDLMRRWDWRNLKVGGKIIGDGTTTLFALPPDWQRLEPGDKAPSGSFISALRPLIPLDGPVNSEQLNQLKQFPSAAILPMWRIIGGAIEIWPAPALAESITFNYISKNLILSSNGTTRQPLPLTDQDTFLIVEDAIMKGVIWRWKSAKGLDYAEEFRAYERAFDFEGGQEDQEREVSISERPVNAGDSWWPGLVVDNSNVPG